MSLSFFGFDQKKTVLTHPLLVPETPARRLANRLRASVRKQVLLVFISSAIILYSLSFSLLSVFCNHQLLVLLESHHAWVQTQEWRHVANGIQASWSGFPSIESLCLFENGNHADGVSRDSKLVYSYGTQFNCHQSKNLITILWGGEFSAVTPHASIRIGLSRALFVYAWLIVAGILLPAAVILLLVRRPLLAQTQAEVVDLLSQFDRDSSLLTDFQKQVQAQTQELVDLRKKAALAQLAAQVAHDIRSPLQALLQVKKQWQGLPEVTVSLMQDALVRIQEVAEDLLQRHMPGNSAFKITHKSAQEIALYPLLESMLAEKKSQAPEGVALKMDIPEDIRALNVKVWAHAGELKRVLSNLVNNSFEALAGAVVHQQERLVILRLQPLQEHWALSVIDDGPGFLEDVLKNLGQSGVTQGKSMGHGLGLFHARTSVLSWGGLFEVVTRPQGGAEVRLILKQPQQEQRLSVFPGEVLIDAVLIDDDALVRRVWQLAAKKSKQELLVFATAERFFVTHELNPVPSATPIYVDLQLAEGESCIEVLQKLHQMGFSALHVATGLPPGCEHDAVLAQCPFLLSVQGKAPLF